MTMTREKMNDYLFTIKEKHNAMLKGTLKGKILIFLCKLFGKTCKGVGVTFGKGNSFGYRFTQKRLFGISIITKIVLVV